MLAVSANPAGCAITVPGSTSIEAVRHLIQCISLITSETTGGRVSPERSTLPWLIHNDLPLHQRDECGAAKVEGDKSEAGKRVQANAYNARVSMRCKKTKSQETGTDSRKCRRYKGTTPRRNETARSMQSRHAATASSTSTTAHHDMRSIMHSIATCTA